MWSKSSPPLNSLTAKCVKQCAVDQLVHGSTQYLPIQMRQAILDYLVRERISVGAQFVCELLQGGGVHCFDMWALADNNLYKPQEVTAILETLANNCASLRELVLGGSTWIYNTRILRGPLKQLFQRKLPSLRSLKIQQVSSSDEFISICEACDNLQKLDISQPSLTDRDIARVEDSLLAGSCAAIRKSLKELRLPSTIKNGGILRLLAIFANVRWLKVTRFETILETLEESAQFEGCAFFEQLKRAEVTLRQLRGLTITHPLGCDTVEQVVDTCPLIEELSLEVQDGMLLSSICRLQHLKRLELRNSPNLPASYLQEVVPVLNEIGSKLETLSLEQFDVLDLAQCARLCPNLNALSAQWFTILGCNRSTSMGMSKAARDSLRTPFQSLRYLRLRPRAEREVQPEAVNFLLTHAHFLEHCELYCCHQLNDDHISKINDTNRLEHLQHLILRHGHSVSKSTINVLTKSSTNLQYLDCGRPLLSKAELVPNDDDNDVNLLNVL